MRDGNSLAAAIVLRDDQVLVVRRSMTEGFLPGTWGIPCGKLEPGEQPADGALRELKEETGLLGLVHDEVGTSSFDSTWNGQTIANLQHNFLVTPLSARITLPEPDQAYRWIPVTELDEAGLDAHNLGAIRQALATL